MADSTGIFLTTTVSKSLFPLLTEVSSFFPTKNPRPSINACPSVSSFASLQQLKQREYLQKQQKLLQRESMPSRRSVSPPKYRTPLLAFSNRESITPIPGAKKVLNSKISPATNQKAKHDEDLLLKTTTKRSFHNYFQINSKNESRKIASTNITTAYDVQPSTTWMNCSNSSLSIGIIGKSTVLPTISSSTLKPPSIMPDIENKNFRFSSVNFN